MGEVPFSYGQLGGGVLTCSNIGGVYVFDGGTWWTGQTTQLEFVLAGGTMAILQDGEELASAPIDASLAPGIEAGVAAGEVTWGRGVFGSLSGVSLEGRVEAAGSSA